MNILKGTRWRHRVTNEIVTVGDSNHLNIGIGGGHAYPREAFYKDFERLPDAPSMEQVEPAPTQPRMSRLMEQYGNASSIAADVVDQVLARDAHGQRKYGVSLDRGDLSTQDWLQHMAEEMMDGAHYALAAKREIDLAERERRDAICAVFNEMHDACMTLMSDSECKAFERWMRMLYDKLRAAQVMP